MTLLVSLIISTFVALSQCDEGAALGSRQFNSIIINTYILVIRDIYRRTQSSDEVRPRELTGALCARGLRAELL